MLRKAQVILWSFPRVAALAQGSWSWRRHLLRLHLHHAPSVRDPGRPPVPRDQRLAQASGLAPVDRLTFSFGADPWFSSCGWAFPAPVSTDRVPGAGDRPRPSREASIRRLAPRTAGADFQC